MGNTTGTSAAASASVGDLPSDLRSWTWEEIRHHNEAEDKTLMVIEGKVFDVTHFLMEHPGGNDVLEEVRGLDATTRFIEVGHSQDAKEMLRDYLVGELHSSV